FIQKNGKATNNPLQNWNFNNLTTGLYKFDKKFSNAEGFVLIHHPNIIKMVSVSFRSVDNPDFVIKNCCTVIPSFRKVGYTVVYPFYPIGSSPYFRLVVGRKTTYKPNFIIV